jgi:hypothetical protein
MDWIQVITLGSYLTAICFFFYYLNEKTIKEWRAEHEKQIQKMDNRMEKMDERMQRMDEKWERLFERLLLQDQHTKSKNP